VLLKTRRSLFVGLNDESSFVLCSTLYFSSLNFAVSSLLVMFWVVERFVILPSAAKPARVAGLFNISPVSTT